MEVQNEMNGPNEPVNLKNREALIAIAIELVEKLNTEEPPVQVGGKNPGEPYKDCLMMFKAIFKIKCGHKTIPTETSNDIWGSLDKKAQQKWKDARKRSKEVFIAGGGVFSKQPKRVRGPINRKKCYCPYCFYGSNSREVFKHIKDVHFPDCSTDECKQQLTDDLATIKDGGKTAACKVRKCLLKFWDILWKDEADLTLAESQLRKRVENLHHDASVGQKCAILYLPTQISDVAAFASIPNKLLPKEVFRYLGIHGDLDIKKIRHTLLCGQAAGKIGKKISSMLVKHIKSRRESKMVIPQQSKLYFWIVAEIPKKSANVFESGAMMALRMLIGRKGKFWNENIPSIAAGMNLRTLLPENLILVGFVFVKNFVIKLKSEVESGLFFYTHELLTYYEGLGAGKRLKFEEKYGIDTNAVRIDRLCESSKDINDLEGAKQIFAQIQAINKVRLQQTKTQELNEEQLGQVESSENESSDNEASGQEGNDVEMAELDKDT